MMDVKQQQEEIEYIRDGVLRKFPRLGVTMSRLKTVVREDIGTAATDGNTVYYAPKFFEPLTDEQKVFIYAHEVMHVAFNHILRSKDRDHRLWNMATDSVINQILKSENLPFVEGGVDIEEAIHHSAEEMYEKLLKEKEEKKQQEQKDKGKGDKGEPQEGQGDGEDGEESEQAGHDNHDVWKEAVKQAELEQQKAEQGEQGKGSIKKALDKLLGRDSKSEEGKEPDEQQSAQDVGDFEKGFEEENRRMRESRAQAIRDTLNREKNRVMAEKAEGSESFGAVGEAEAVLDWKKILKKTIEKEQDRGSYRRSGADNDYSARVEEMDEDDLSETEVMLDVSGSVSNQFLKEFLRQLKPILKTSKLKVGCFDEHFYGLSEVKNNADIDSFKITAKSRWTENWDLAVKSFSKKKEVNKIVFTDGHPCPGTMPDESTRGVNVIWLVYGNQDFHPVCGKVIQVDPNQIKQSYLIKEAAAKKISTGR